MAFNEQAVRGILGDYCVAVQRIRQDVSHHPETSLYSPFEHVLIALAQTVGYPIEIIQQYRLEAVGAPDFGIRSQNGTISFIEAKSPDKNLGRLTGHDKSQFEKYMHLGNVVYTNYTELRLYQVGELQQVAELVPVQALEPTGARRPPVIEHDVAPAIELLERFFTFSLPDINSVETLAGQLARSAWLVRDAVKQSMQLAEENSPLQQIYREFRDVLFYELTPDEFSDAYAQTLAYGLLLARQATQIELTTSNIASFVDAAHHRLLAATLRLLSQPPVVQMVGWTIANLVAVVNRVSPGVLSITAKDQDPLLYFYEDFLEIYDPDLRKKLGVYYTPPPVVNLQTRVASHLLVRHFGRRYGFADETVQTLDPAVGTGTYLISALNQACEHVGQAIGQDSIPGAATAVGKQLNGFEILVGPYTVAHYRLASAIKEKGGETNTQLPIWLTDTLLPAKDQPNISTQFGFMSGPLTQEREAADRVKNDVPVMVILGNPPYKRGKADIGWVWTTLLEDFREPVRGEHSVDLKNLADPYVSFYRWAMWKLFEAGTAPKSGILSFISNSRWILGGAFGGMRQVARTHFDRIYIIDLHGDNRAPLPASVANDQNVFEIQVGVAISICIADGSRNGQEAEVYYFGDTWGTREEKYNWLNSIAADLSNVTFTLVDGAGTDPFFPNLGELFKGWPSLQDDIFIFAHSGVQTKRDHMSVAPTKEKLKNQILSFLNAPDQQKSEIFHDTPSKSAADVATHTFDPNLAISYGYRPLDTQYLYNHAGFLDRRRPKLQKVWGQSNLGMFTLPSGHGAGPVVFLHHHLPDIHAFRGSYGGYIFPLLDNSQNSEGQQSFIEKQYNLNPKLLKSLAAYWGKQVTAEDVFSYCFAVLSAPSYSLEFSHELVQSFPRVPFPTTWGVFQQAVDLGGELINIHSFEERYPADGSFTITGSPEYIEQAEFNQEQQRVYLASTAWVEPVSAEAWNYSVSGYEVLRQWILRRRQVPFDLALKEGLLDVVWAVERTVELSSQLDDFLSQLLEGSTLNVNELGLVD